MHMRSGVTAAVVALVMVAPAAPAVAQPAGNGNALATIGQLEAAGYDVVVDRVGGGPLSQCVVTSVRNPHTVTQTFWVDDGDDRDLVTVVTSRTISVSLNCAT